MISKTLKNGYHSVGVSVNVDKTHVLLQCTDRDSQARICLEASEVEELVDRLLEFSLFLKKKEQI